jgi:hypothetical protein
MFDHIDSKYFVKTFKRKVCSLCQMCNEGDPSFCILIFSNDASGFLNLVKNLMVAREIKRSDILDGFYTFEGFCGAFCNGHLECLGRTDACLSIEAMFSCYKTFLMGIEGKFDLKKLKIMQAMLEVKPHLVGQKYRSQLDTIMNAIPKKKRKKINKSIEAAKKELKRTEWKNERKSIRNEKKRKASIETEFFCNDNDEEWEGRIEQLLNETDN